MLKFIANTLTYLLDFCRFENGREAFQNSVQSIADSSKITHKECTSLASRAWENSKDIQQIEVQLDDIKTKNNRLSAIRNVNDNNVPESVECEYTNFVLDPSTERDRKQLANRIKDFQVTIESTQRQLKAPIYDNRIQIFTAAARAHERCARIQENLSQMDNELYSLEKCRFEVSCSILYIIICKILR